MRRRATRHGVRLARVAILPVLLALAQASAQDADPATELSTLLEAFEANYVESSQLRDAAWQVEALGRQLEQDAWPRLTFSERAAWRDFSRLSLELDLHATLPLYRGRALPLATLHEHRVQLITAEAGSARREARNLFQRDLLSLSLLRTVNEQLLRALRAADLAGWQQPRSLEAALNVPPNLRELVGLYSGVEGAQGMVESRLADLERRVAAALGANAAPLELPAFDHLLPHVLPPEVELSTCLARSPLAMQAHLHHEIVALESEAQRVPDIRVELRGGVVYRSGAPAGTVALEAYMPLPAASPVGGQVNASVDPSGAEQSLRLSWPAAVLPNRPRSTAELEEHREAERSELEIEIVTMLRAAEAAAEDVVAAEIQLLWVAHDLHLGTAGLGTTGAPPTSDQESLAAARQLANTPLADPFAELRRVRYWSEWAFARLTHAEQRLTVGLLCGQAP